jgi:disulfide bond formation protein DsbB
MIMQSQSQALGPEEVPWLTGLALLVAVAGVAGSLWLSMGMGLKACPLCFYQRTFALGIMGVLGVGLLAGMGRVVSLSVLVLPLAVGGLGVAGWHVNLERTGKLECPAGFLGLGTAPQQSLAMFALLTLVLVVDALPTGRRGGGLLPAAGAVVVGACFTLGCIKSSPPGCIPPGEYDNPTPTICRPPRPG